MAGNILAIHGFGGRAQIRTAAIQLVAIDMVAVEPIPWNESENDAVQSKATKSLAILSYLATNRVAVVQEPSSSADQRNIYRVDESISEQRSVSGAQVDAGCNSVIAHINDRKSGFDRHATARTVGVRTDLRRTSPNYRRATRQTGKMDRHLGTPQQSRGATPGGVISTDRASWRLDNYTSPLRVEAA